MQLNNRGRPALAAGVIGVIGAAAVIIAAATVGVCGRATAAPGNAPPTTSPADAGATTAAVRALVTAACTGHDVPAATPATADWLKANGESVTATRERGLAGSPASAEQPWGLVSRRPAGGGAADTLYLHVFDWHAGGKVVVYGLAADVKRAYLLADPKRAELKVEKTGRDIIVEAGAKNSKPQDAADTVVALELAGEPKAVPLAVAPAADGSVLLHARDAVVHGRTLRYEPEPNKNTLGYWTNAADWAAWEFTVAKAGDYSVEVLQGCGKGSGGSDVELAVDERVLPFTVQDTGGFQNFVARDVGKVKLAEGKHVLTVRPKKKPGLAVMDLRQVTLKPG